MEYTLLPVQIQNSETVTRLVTGLHYGGAIHCMSSYLREPKPLKKADMVHVPSEARRSDPCVYAVEDNTHLHFGSHNS
jgi:hypothetical protein